MQPSYPLVLSGLAFSLLATATLRSAEPEPAKVSPAPTPSKAASTDPFVKGDGPSQADAGGKHPVPPPSAVFVQEVYTLKKEDALAVLEATAAGTDRYQRVLALERENKARLRNLTALANKSGHKAVVQGVESVRYASVFRAPTDAMPKGSVLPTNFEVRNAGDTWEMEATLPEAGGTGAIDFASKHVGLLGYTGCPAWPGDPVVEQPRFTAQSLATTTAFRLDEPVFLGTFTPSGSNGFLKGEGAEEIALAFLRVHLLPPEVARERSTATTGASVPQGLSVQYSVYSMERRLAREVANAGPGSEAPWEKLQGILQEKRAKIEHVFAIATRSGRKSTGEETDEVLYGTQFAPPEYFYPTPSTVPAQSTDKKQSAASPESPGIRISGTTEAVEMRRAGLVFELEPVLAPDGAAIDLIHQLSAVTYLGNLDAKTVPAQPLFESRTFASSLTIGVGKHVLAATFNPPSPDGVNGRTRDDGQTALMFVRVAPAQP